MIVKKPLLYAVIAGVNAVSLTAALALTLAGGAIARSQTYNGAAQRWDRDGGSTQISCFFSDDAGFNTDGMYALRAKLNSELTAAASGPNGMVPEIADAYSTPIGSAYVTAVGGDFFLFRDFRLLSGAYFSDGDIMQDGAVIERSLAFTLYGSSNVAGQLIYIDGVQFYISGVIDDPTDKYQKRTADEMPRVYVSYKGAESLPQVMYSDFLYSCSLRAPLHFIIQETLCHFKYSVIRSNTVELFNAILHLQCQKIRHLYYTVAFGSLGICYYIALFKPLI